MIKLRDVLRRAREDKKMILLLLAGAAGLLLLLLSGVNSADKTAAPADTFSLRRQTEQALEKKAERLLGTVAGVGRVRVIVTLDSLEETVYARDSAQRNDGGSDEYVIIRQNSSESGLSQRVIMPTVRGIAVSCEGAGSAAVRQEVASLLCAAFGVGANRVYISRMAE